MRRWCAEKREPAHARKVARAVFGSMNWRGQLLANAAARENRKPRHAMALACTCEMQLQARPLLTQACQNLPSAGRASLRCWREGLLQRQHAARRCAE